MLGRMPVNLSRLLKGESMKFGCNHEGACSFKFLVASQSRYQPAKSVAVSKPNVFKYLRLHNGDIYCVKTDSILSRKYLIELLDG